MTESGSWEDLEQLTLQPSSQPAMDTSLATNLLDASRDDLQGEVDPIDQALKEALKNPRERANVLRIEDDVARFVSDKTRCTIEFAPDLSSYQRLLAHRVSQLYGLQTSSVPFGNGMSRVIAHKTQETKFPPVRVIDVKDLYRPPEAEKTSSTPDVVIKRRSGAALDHLAPDGAPRGLDGMTGGPRSVKQREEEYKAARERILGPELRPGIQEEDQLEEDGRNRKAVFRDKIKEQQDPDYKRSSSQFHQSSLIFDQSAMIYEDQRGQTGIFNSPNYSSEFSPMTGSRIHGPPSFPSMNPLNRPPPPPPLAPRILPPTQFSMPYPGFGFPPRAVQFRSPTSGSGTRPLSPLWSPPPISSPGPLITPPPMYTYPVQYPGYPPGYPMPPRGVFVQRPVSSGGSEGGPVGQTRTLRRKPMPPSTESDFRTQRQM